MNILQILRSTITKARPAGRKPGEPYVNFADKAFGVVGADGSPLDLSAVRFWSPQAEYVGGDMVVYNTRLYRCGFPHPPAATFDSSQWTELALEANVIAFWSQSRRYSKGDWVVRAGDIWRANTTINAGTPWTGTQWVKVTPIVEWEAQRNYNIGQVVWHGGELYRCKEAIAGSPTNTFDATKWDRYLTEADGGGGAVIPLPQFQVPFGSDTDTLESQPYFTFDKYHMDLNVGSAFSLGSSRHDGMRLVGDVLAFFTANTDRMTIAQNGDVTVPGKLIVGTIDVGAAITALQAGGGGSGSGGSYTLPAATAAALGGVKATANPGNQFVIGVAADGSLTYGAVAWSQVSGKPSTFTPAAHTHAQSEITGLDSALNGINTLVALKANTSYVDTQDNALTALIGGKADRTYVDAQDSAITASLGTKVPQTSSTGAANLPKGNTSQRPAPAAGMIRYNTETNKFEASDGTQWGSVGADPNSGAAAADGIFYLNDMTVTKNYTIPAGKNAGSFGPITIANGVTVTIPDGGTWSVV